LLNVAVLRRILLVCLFSLVAVRGVMACKPAQYIALTSRAAVAVSDSCGKSDADSTTDANGHGSHCAHCAYCASCCVHWGAPLAASSFGVHVSGSSTLAALAVALRAGITHAPPLPPPIA